MRYLLIKYVLTPQKTVDEQMSVSNRLRNSDIDGCNVILDFKKQQVIKCTMEGNTVPKVWDRVVGYYYQHYANTLERLFLENGHLNPFAPRPQEEATAPADTAQSA